MIKEHVLEGDNCWCHPNDIDGVIVHRDNEDYLAYELTLIGDICIDYDGYRTTDGLKGLIDELRERAYSAVGNVS
jgi:hypothetical protein